MSLFEPSRDQAREFLFALWAKYRAGEPLAGVEPILLEIVLAHPEYHALLENPARYREREYRPEDGEANPFLHLMLHLALVEQLSVEQPPGVRAVYAALCTQLGEPVAAQHALMECLAEEVWRVQRHRQAFDAARYLDCARARARG
jgi:hypothetical protein